jgi:hypothetical protein
VDNVSEGLCMTSTIAVVTLLLLFTATTVVQAQTNELTLGCNGKVTADRKEYIIANIDVVVNLMKKTVTGFNGVIANINSVDDVTIFFQGEDQQLLGDDPLATFYVIGNINRMTGVASVVTTVYGNEEVGSSSSYFELVCTPGRSW